MREVKKYICNQTSKMRTNEKEFKLDFKTLPMKGGVSLIT